MKFLKIKEKKVVSHLTSVAILLFSSIFVWALMGLLISSDSTLYFTGGPPLWFLNYLPILLLMFFVYGFTANAPFSASIVGGFFLICGIINENKIILREDPLIPSDFWLLGELSNILKDFDFGLLLIALGVVIGFILFCVFMLILFKGKPIKIWLRCIICFLCVDAIILSFAFLYQNDTLYNSFEIEGDIYSRIDQYQGKGWQYSFTQDIPKVYIKAPQGYDKTTYAAKEAAAVDVTTYTETAKPNVIMIMSEAFTKTSENEVLHYDGLTDPLENYKAVAADAVVQGELKVNTYGGGTAQTEFEVLTGMNIQSLHSSLSLYNVMSHKVDALPWLFKDLGYDTLALHPGDGWFYNRKNVYSFLGFDDYYYLGHGVSEKTEIKGYYVSETATYDHLIDNINDQMAASENPLFELCVTIQNHGGYSGKYNLDGDVFQTDLPLSEEDHLALSNYLYGVTDCDQELDRFIDYIYGLSEPFVVVYFGDHYPAVNTAYDTIGYDSQATVKTDEETEKYYTPFFIWQNEAAAQTTPLQANAEALNLEGDVLMNANYLGPLVTELLGVDSASPFFAYTNLMRKTLPVQNGSKYFDSSYQLLDTLNPTQSAMEKTYEEWSYYKFMDEK